LLPADALVKQINVEIEGLKAVAAAMRKELDHGFRTQVPQVHDAMQPGAVIGGPIPGMPWVDLQNTYTRCIQTTVDALFNLDMGTQAVAKAAEIIARDYGDADAFVQAKVDDVYAVLVTPAAPQTPAPASPPAVVTGD
jgi:hypothetical protein